MFNLQIFSIQKPISDIKTPKKSTSTSAALCIYVLSTIITGAGKTYFQLNPLCTNRFFLLVWYNKLWMVHFIYQRITCYNFQIKIVFLSLYMILVLANSEEPDEMPHYAAFHLGLHCLPSRHLGITFLAHRIRISDILPWDKKSYLTHAILPRLSREGYIHWLYWNSHCHQVRSLLC